MSLRLIGLYMRVSPEKHIHSAITRCDGSTHNYMIVTGVISWPVDEGNPNDGKKNGISRPPSAAMLCPRGRTVSWHGLLQPGATCKAGVLFDISATCITQPFNVSPFKLDTAFNASTQLNIVTKAARCPGNTYIDWTPPNGANRRQMAFSSTSSGKLFTETVAPPSDALVLTGNDVISNGSTDANVEYLIHKVWHVIQHIVHCLLMMSLIRYSSH